MTSFFKPSAGSTATGTKAAASTPVVTPKWLPKFECKSTRVKGLSFHPTRPWVAASMHNGTVQIWDYKLGVRIESFDEHDGPVRSVAFHPTQPLLASAGDDHKIRIWNYKLRKCVHTFEGHSDYIRSVAFHHDFPWLISASDDQTARIWNWQSRSCIAVITGHTHYIMCAAFHPSQDLVATCSLDQTIRIWDISGLCKKHSAAGRGFSATSLNGHPATGTSGDDKINPDYFGPFDVVIKHVLEGHDRGVNWVSFHPTKPLFLSCSDDRLVKVWRMNDSQAWELDSFRSHSNNVSCALFVPSQDWIVSDGEDKTLKVWDMNKKSLLFSQKKENDRFWALAIHPSNDNLLAAGFDSGFVVFKLQSERPAMQVNPADLSFWYVKDRSLHHFSLPKGQQKDIISASLANCKYAIQSVDVCAELKLGLFSYCNPQEQAEIIPISSTKQSFANFKLPYSKAVFIASSVVASYQPSSSSFSLISLKNLNDSDNGGTLLKEFKDLPFSIKSIFPSNSDDVCLVVSSGKLLNFNLNTGTVSSEVELNSNSPIKRIYWNSQKTCFCVLLKKSLFIFDSALGMVLSVNENVSVKSVAWNDKGNVVYYSTSQHLKFLLLNGDQGILCSTSNVEYIGSVSPGKLYCLDRHGKVCIHPFEYSEVDLKLALNDKNFEKVASIINDCNLVGESIIAYLRNKGYAQIALSFVKEPASRFELALGCGDLDAAVEACSKLDSPASWELLAEEASKHGNTGVMETCYQRTNNFSKLAFLYTITGNSEKLKKLANVCHDSEQFADAILCDLYLGQVEKSLKMLEKAQLNSVAYLMCKSQGYNDEAAEFLSETGIDPEEVEAFPAPTVEKRSSLLQSNTKAGWKVAREQSKIDKLFQFRQPIEVQPTRSLESLGVLDEPIESVKPAESIAYPAFGEQHEWEDTALELANKESLGWDNDLSFPAEETSPHPTQPRKCSFIQALKRGLPMNEIEAILSSQHSVANIEPISDLIYFYSESDSIPLSLNEIQSKIANPLLLTTNGKFSDALREFSNCLYLCLFSEDATDEIIRRCKEYLLGLKMEIARKEPSCPTEDSLKLAILFSLCQLQNDHLILSLRSAMSVLYKAKNFKSCLCVAERLLGLDVDETIAGQARKIVALCEKNPTDSIDLGIDFEPENLSQIVAVCSKSFSPIFDSNVVSCPFCNSVAKDSFEGEPCSICQLCLLAH